MQSGPHPGASLGGPLRALASVAALAGLLFAACYSDPCQQVANRICACEPGPGQASCNSLVSAQLSNGNQGQKPNSGDHGVCNHLLDTCHDPSIDHTMCASLNTEQGKINCGMAYAPSAAYPQSADP